MGVAGLEKFIRNSNISQEIDIRRKIEQWRNERKSDPIIIIDVKELMRMFYRIDEGGLILGGRYQKSNEILEYFFREMKKSNAELVFFVRLHEGKITDADEFQSIFPAYDCITEHKSLKDFLDKTRVQNEFKSGISRPNERIMYNFVQKICPKYGQVYIKYELGKRCILAYARENRENVMALITRNTEFLVLESEFQYWSLSDVQFCELKIAKFCREKLDETFGLNVQQMQLLLAISQLELKVRDQLVGWQGNANRLHQLADYVKKQEYGPNGYEQNQLTGDLTEDHRNEIAQELTDISSINNFASNWKDDVYDGLILDLMNNDKSFNLMIQFCKEKNLLFAFKLLSEARTAKKDLFFIDIRRPDALPFIDLVINVTMKLCGIFFKDVEPDKQPKTRTVKIKRFFEEEAVESEVDIIYPTMPLPSLNDLINDEENKSFDQSRWSLLEWLLDLDEEMISKIKNSQQRMRIVLLTLTFLLLHEIITRREADILLLTELDGRTKRNVYVPRNFCPPPPMPDTRYPNVDMSWVQTAHKYTIAFELICHCLELCGLRKETDIIEMDAFKFHQNMKVVENGGDNEQKERMMTQISDIRLW